MISKLIFYLDFDNPFNLLPMCFKQCIFGTFLIEFRKKEQKTQANYSGGLRTHDIYNARADVLPPDHRASVLSADNLAILRGTD